MEHDTVVWGRDVVWVLLRLPPVGPLLRSIFCGRTGVLVTRVRREYRVPQSKVVGNITQERPSRSTECHFF